MQRNTFYDCLYCKNSNYNQLNQMGLKARFENRMKMKKEWDGGGAFK